MQGVLNGLPGLLAWLPLSPLPLGWDPCYSPSISFLLSPDIWLPFILSVDIYPTVTCVLHRQYLGTPLYLDVFYHFFPTCFSKDPVLGH